MATSQAQMTAQQARLAAKLSPECPDQKEMESDEEVLKEFINNNKYSVKAAPTSEQMEEINSFVDAEAHELDQVPHMRQQCNQMAMEFFVESAATEWIYLTNRSSENADDEQIIGCKKLAEGEKAIAVFAVADNWKVITPYACNENGSVAGNQIVLIDPAQTDEQMVQNFLKNNPAANECEPSEEELETINSFVVADEPKADIQCALACDGMCMEFSCEGAEWIYLTNKQGDDEQVVACKQGDKAVFEVLDGWSNITPYAYKDEEATQGEEIALADEEDNPDFEQMDNAAVDKFYANIEPEYQKEAFQADQDNFKVSKEGDKLKIQAGVPVEHIWARSAAGDLIGAVQFSDEPEEQQAELELKDGINEARVYAFTQDEDGNSVTIGAEFSL